MPEVTIEEQPNVEEESAAPKAAIGIIYPPPEVRNIVDKTAIFVARNGPEFEARIQQNEQNNPKFNFLNPNDPYHNYYKHKVKEVIEGKVTNEPTATPKSGLGYVQQKPAQEQQFKLPETIVVKDPPPEFEYIADAPSISAFDLDIVKLTAQFVARNGRQFLNNLMNRESRNFQFDFLRPQHSLFNYFTKLVEQYTKILLPPKDLASKLDNEAADPKNILNQVMYRVEWMKLQEREKKKEEDEIEKERVAYAQIDWHEFGLAEVIGMNFDVNDMEYGTLPPFTSPEGVGLRQIAQERHEQTGDSHEVKRHEEVPKSRSINVGDNMKVIREEEAPAPESDTRVQDMEEDSDSDTEMEQEKIVVRPSPIPKEVPQIVNNDQLIIRKDYDPKANRTIEVANAPDVFLISPFTHEKVPAHKVKEHVRIGLLDPKWLEQRDKAIQDKREQEEVYAPGSNIGSNLRQLAERRTDIFGFGNEETEIGRKIGEEEKREKAKVIWDGHSTSGEKVAQKARENITIEDQIAVIHKTKGLLPDEEKEKIGPAMPKNIHQASSATFSAPAQPPSISHGMPMMRPATQQMVRPPMIPSMTGRPMGIMAPLPILMGQPSHGMMPQIPIGRSPFLSAGSMLSGLGPQAHLISAMHPQMPGMGMDMNDDEHPSKRMKLDDSLIPEHEFLARNPNPVEFKVQVPMIDKSEWNLSGQIFSVVLPLSDTVSVIKAKIFDEVGMPAGKQKLQLDGMFLKDSNTLAYYNITANSVVGLQLKERGGRKK